MKKGKFSILFGLAVCLLLTSCNGLTASTTAPETSATTTGGGVTTSTTTTPEKTTTAPVIDYTDHNIYIFKLYIADMKEWDTFREMARFEDREASENYLYRKLWAGCTDVRPERFSAFVELMESLPLLPLLQEGEVTEVFYTHQINRRSSDDPGEEIEQVTYVVRTSAGDRMEIVWDLTVDDVVGTIAAKIAANPEHALATPIRSADGRMTVYTIEQSSAGTDGNRTVARGCAEIDGAFVTYYYNIASESNVNIVTQLPLLSLTDLVEKAE